jgi:hypothetical protein
VISRFGYPLIKVDEREAAGKAPFSGAGPRLKALLKSERRSEKLHQSVASLKAKAKIGRFDLAPGG